MKSKKNKVEKSKSKLKSKSKKASKKPAKKRGKKSSNIDDSGIIVIDDDLEIDAEKELEERRAYLEEARSQDSGD